MRIVVTNNVSLDGVTQAPAGVDEDRRGGFEHGGWARTYGDATMTEQMGLGMARSGGLLLGRRTYEDFFGFWPTQTDGNPFTEHLNRATKYVVSQTLHEPLPWENSILLAGDPVERVRDLKQQDGPDLSVIGSGELVRTLTAAGLVDEHVLLIHPLLLGSGQRLFAEDSPFQALALTGSVATSTGVIIARYVPATGALQ